jgi:diguanylate cyclase (GGDEF)-like protein
MRGYDLTSAKNKLEDIRNTIENSPTTFYNKRVSATLTIGVEEYSKSYKDVEDLIKVADERMYYGKQHGKNIVIDKTVE